MVSIYMWDLNGCNKLYCRHNFRYVQPRQYRSRFLYFGIDCYFSSLATLPGIIGTTYFKQFASQPKISAKVMKASVILTAGSCLLFILLIKPLVVFLYSEEYSTVGTYDMAFCWI